MNPLKQEHLVAVDGVVDTEGDAVQVRTVGLVRASTVEDQLVLGVADVDGAVAIRAGVSARGGAVGRAARALRLGNGLAVGDVSDVGALAAIRAGSDGLKMVLEKRFHTINTLCIGLCLDSLLTTSLPVISHCRMDRPSLEQTYWPKVHC